MRDPREDISPFLVGLISLPAQALLVRELLARGGGSEIALTLYLGLWLAGSALGARFWEGRTVSIRPLLVAAPLAALIPLSIARFLPVIGSIPGEAPRPVAIGLAGLLVLFPMAFGSAGLFPISARDRAGRGSSLTRAYVAEALGALTGGCATTLLVIARVPPVEILLLVAATAAVLSSPFRWGVPAGAILLLIGVSGISAHLDDLLFRHAWNTRHPGLRLEAHAMTPTRALALAGREGEEWLLADDAPREVLDDPYRDEATAALLLSTPPARPRAVLLVDFGASGIARALVQAGVPRVACLVPDREDTILARPPSGVRYIVGDPRRSLRRIEGGWDLIAVAACEATSLTANRLWTREAFREMSSCLGPRGVIVAIAPGGDAAPGPEARAWRASVASALGEAASGPPEAIDADRFVLVGSARAGEGSLDPDTLALRYAKGGASLPTYPAARFLVEYPRDRRVRFATAPDIRPNTDRRPAAFPYAIGRWLRQSGMATPPRWLLAVLIAGLAAAPVLAPVLASAILSRDRSAAGRPASGADARRAATVLLATGAASMGLDLLVLMAYQIRVGMLQGGLGALLGSFLGGTALGAMIGEWVGNPSGSRAASRAPSSAGLRAGPRAGPRAEGRGILTVLCLCQAGIAVVTAVGLSRLPEATAPYAVLAALLGATCGAPFPIASRALGAGRAWASDAGGGILGAILFLLVISQGIGIAGIAMAAMPLLAAIAYLPRSTAPGSPSRTSDSARP